VKSSTVYGTYEKAIDRESAYEILTRKAEKNQSDDGAQSQAANDNSGGTSVLGSIFGSGSSTGKRTRQSPFEAMISSAARSIGSQIGRSISRGIFGSMTSGGRKRW
jgi:hypothetical protein